MSHADAAYPLIGLSRTFARRPTGLRFFTELRRLTGLRFPG